MIIGPCYRIMLDVAESVNVVSVFVPTSNLRVMLYVEGNRAQVSVIKCTSMAMSSINLSCSSNQQSRELLQLDGGIMGVWAEHTLPLSESIG